jgi:hypothetical protein
MTDTATNPNKLVDFVKFVFRFKKDEFDNKRPNVVCEKVPVPSFEGVQEILTKGGKGFELLQEAMSDVVRAALSDKVGDDTAFDPEKFDYSAISWETIANMPKEDRRSSTIDPAVWAAFAEDYMAIMPALTAKSQDKIKLAIEMYVKKLTPIKTRKQALSTLGTQLALYVDNSKKAEEFTDILQLLTRRIETYMKADDPKVLEEAL